MDKFTAKHIGFVLLGVGIVSLKSYPSLLTRNGGRDTWMAMGIAGLLAMLYLFFMLHVFKKCDFKNLISIYKAAVGKWLGYIFLFFFILTLFMTLVESASVEANSMHTNMLLQVPPWMFLLFFIPPGLYAVKKGIGAIITITIISMVLVSISGMNLAFLTAPYKHFNYLKPFLENGISSGLILSLLQELGLFGCLAIAFPFIPYLGDKTSFIKYLMIAMLFVFQVEFIAMSGVLMTFDVSLLNTMSYPKLLQTQLISQFRFLEAGELFVMLQMVGGWFVKYVLCMFAMIHVIEKLNIKIKHLGLWISLVCFVASYYISKDLFLLFKYLNIYTYVCLINFVIIPFFIFLIYALRGYPKGKDAKTE